MKKILKCFIIEDEPLAVSQLKSLIAKEKNLTLLSFVDDIEDVHSFLFQLKDCDILFLDLKVRGGDIGSLQTHIWDLPNIIIISALAPQDYPTFIKKRKHLVLQKPITIDRFNSCINSILNAEKTFSKNE